MAYKPDIGTIISLNTGVTITGATVTIEAKKPSGVTASWGAVISTDNQSVEHTVVAGDFTEAGVYNLQAKVSLGGNLWYGNTTQLTVKSLFS